MGENPADSLEARFAALSTLPLAPRSSPATTSTTTSTTTPTASTTSTTTIESTPQDSDIITPPERGIPLSKITRNRPPHDDTPPSGDPDPLADRLDRLRGSTTINELVGRPEEDLPILPNVPTAFPRTKPQALTRILPQAPTAAPTKASSILPQAPTAAPKKASSSILPQAPTTAPTKSPASLGTWCFVCFEDAVYRCASCPQMRNMFCEECWYEMHVGPRADVDQRGHRAVRLAREDQGEEEEEGELVGA